MPNVRHVLKMLSRCLVLTLLVAVPAQGRGLCDCYTDSGMLFKSECTDNGLQCRATCGFTHPNFKNNHSLCQPLPAPQVPPPPPQPIDPTAPEIRGPKATVAPCTSQTCNECCYHNNGEAAVVLPANANILEVRNYVSDLNDPNSNLWECKTGQDCQYATFFMDPIIRQSPSPMGWTGPPLSPGQVFVVRPFKNWSHNRIRAIQLVVRYKLPAESTDADNHNFRHHLVKRGQSLASIAKLYYGRPAWQQLYEANRDLLKKPESIRVGQVIRIPF